MSAVDPAVDGEKRIASLDMLIPANGYDPATESAKYSSGALSPGVISLQPFLRSTKTRCGAGGSRT
jgi:hypothetical protein